MWLETCLREILQKVQNPERRGQRDSDPGSAPQYVHGVGPGHFKTCDVHTFLFTPIRRNTFTAFRETHPSVRFKLFPSFPHKNLKIHDFHGNSKENYHFTWKSSRIRLWHLKIPKKPIGFVDVFGPRPAGAPLLPKVPISTPFHQNIGEMSIIVLK